MTFSIGIVGAGQFSGQFATLFQAHPGVSDVYVTDLLPERAGQLASAQGLTGTFPSYQAMLELVVPKSMPIDGTCSLIILISGVT